MVEHVRIRGVYELAPTDFGSTKGGGPLDAEGAHWGVLVGSCDGDVFQVCMCVCARVNSSVSLFLSASSMEMIFKTY